MAGNDIIHYATTTTSFDFKFPPLSFLSILDLFHSFTNSILFAFRRGLENEG